MSRVKICGLRTVADAAIINEVRPDFAGMIFAHGRKRTITHDTAAAIRDTIDSSIPTVGVFLDNPIDEIVSVMERGIIQYVQLHGAEDAAYITALRERCFLPIIKAFRIESADDLKEAAASCADWILLDSGNGGTGEAFDWSLLQSMPRPYFLAGGLTPENVAEAAMRFSPYCLDVSSGVEVNGSKHLEYCRRFVEAARKNI